MEFVENVIYPLLVLPGLFLYPIAFFTPHWVSDDRCDEVGLFYRCCTEVQNDIDDNTRNSTNITAPTTASIIKAVTDNRTSNATNTTLKVEGIRSCGYVGKDALDVRVLGLQATSVTFTLICILLAVCMYFEKCMCSCDGAGDICRSICSVFFHIYEIACNDKDDGGLKAIQFLSGVLNFAACMLIVKNYDSHQFGYSFYVCLIPCSITMFIVGLCIIAPVLLCCYVICFEDTDDTNTKTFEKKDDHVSKMKIVQEDDKTDKLSSGDVAVEMKGKVNQALGSDELPDDGEKVPTNEYVTHDMSDQDTTTIIVQAVQPKPKLTDGTGSDTLDAKPGTSSAVEIEKDATNTHKKKGGSSMAESLAKLNVKNLFVLSIGSCHCVCVTKKDENTEV